MRYFGTMKEIDGVLSIGGIKVTELADKYQTPLYVMDLELIEENINKYKKYFKSELFNGKIVYASKAFLCKEMCKIVDKYGIDIDAVSGGELYLIHNSGIDMKKVHMHGNNKSIEELNMCLDYNIGSIIVDGKDEIEKLSKLCKEKDKKIDALLRINVGIDAHTHEYIKTSKHNSKFGESIFDKDFVTIVKRIANDSNIIFRGFHCHIGSQIFDTEAFFEEIKILVEQCKKFKEEYGIEIKDLDLGGGFGVYYSQADRPLEIENFMTSLIKYTEKILHEENVEIENLYIEPGRSIVANAGTTIYTIGGKKETYGGIKYIFIDGGMTDNIRPALYQAKYEAEIGNKLNEKEKEVVTIAGKCCESGDVLIKNIEISKGEVGDFLVIPTTGAYGYAMANTYNKVPRPPVVFVKDGKDKLVIRRETYEDLLKYDL